MIGSAKDRAILAANLRAQKKVLNLIEACHRHGLATPSVTVAVQPPATGAHRIHFALLSPQALHAAIETDVKVLKAAMRELGMIEEGA